MPPSLTPYPPCKPLRPPAGENPVPPAVSPAYAFEQLRQRHPHYNLLPLLELLSVNSPDAYEAFFNHLIELVCWQLQNEDWDNAYLLRILREFFHLRDAFREVSNAEAWQ